jgi:hypothetical protein
MKQKAIEWQIRLEHNVLYFPFINSLLSSIHLSPVYDFICIMYEIISLFNTVTFVTFHFLLVNLFV